MALTTYQDLASILEYPLLAPDLPAAKVLEGLARAKRYNIAAVIVRPCDIDVAARTLEGSAISVGSVVGFPHGSETTGAKVFEARDLLRRGAKELEVVIGISRVLNREFQHVQTELNQLADLCRQENALLKVTLEVAYLTSELKTIACVCCERADVHMVKTSSGFGPSGYAPEDLNLMREHLPEEIGICAEGGMLSLDRVLEAHSQGATRVSAPDPFLILDAWKSRLSEVQSAPQQPLPPVTAL